MNRAAPAFSVILPTKDRPRMLERAIRSVMAQRETDYEIIVADDGAGEGIACAEALVGCGVAFETGARGQVPARNMALARTRGRWIAFLDDDDWWASPDYLGAMRAGLAGASFCYASGRIVQETADMVPRERSAPPGGLPFAAAADAASIRRDNTLLVSGIAYEAALHDRYGAFDETLPVYWDWDWYLRLASAGVAFRPAGIDAVRISARTDSVSASANQAGRAAELIRLSDKHGLTGIVLKNHESIAVEQAGLRPA